LRKEAWQAYLDDKEHTGTLIPIIALAKEHNPKMVEEKLTPEQRAKILKALPGCILMIYRYWQSSGGKGRKLSACRICVHAWT
jgi:Uncharacterised protein family (UPF0149)